MVPAVTSVVILNPKPLGRTPAARYDAVFHCQELPTFADEAESTTSRYVPAVSEIIAGRNARTPRPPSGMIESLSSDTVLPLTVASADVKILNRKSPAGVPFVEKIVEYPATPSVMPVGTTNFWATALVV